MLFFCMKHDVIRRMCYQNLRSSRKNGGKGMKKVLASILVLCMVFSLCAVSASADDVIKLKMHFVDPETAPYVQGGQKIAELVSEATDGKIQIEVLSGGSLGGERDTIELAMDNSLDIATCANSVLTNFIPEMGILDQAYLWKNADEAHAAVDGRLGELIKEKAEAIGLHVIGFLSLSMSFCRSFGNPPTGCPIIPSKNDTIESGKSIPLPFSMIFSGVRSFCTMKIAISPTAFDDGVTFTMSPSIWFTSLYIFFTSLILWPRPKLSTCACRLEYCPPGISYL